MGIRLLGTVFVPFNATEGKGVLTILGKHQGRKKMVYVIITQGDIRVRGSDKE